MISQICAVFCLFVQLGLCTLYIEKECPPIEPVPNLDWKGLSGTWYEQARYDNDYEIKAHCVSVNFSVETNMFYSYEILGDEPFSFSGSMRPASNGTGVIFFHSSLYKKVDNSDELVVAVVAMDANNYMVMYDCKYDEETKKRHDYLWVLSRFKTYGGETKAFVDDLLDKTPYFDKSKLVWQDLSPKSCNR